MSRVSTLLVLLLVWMVSAVSQTASSAPRPRIREVGVQVGVIPPGPLNAITDVAGVAVGQTTIVRGDDVRTGVTAILPHGGNLFREKVPGAVFVGNGFGKLTGSTQVNELGEIETPVVLTSTLAVPRVADAVMDYIMALPGNEDVQSVNPVVGETNDGYLNDIRSRPITRDDMLAAIKGAKGGAVEEGSVGAGTGTVAFGWKGGIGTASRKLPASLGGYTVGVLVQTNFGGVLTIAGAPVGQELGRYVFREELEGSVTSSKSAPQRTQRGAKEKREKASREDDADGSCMIVVATDAPVEARNLKRLAARAIMGMARTGAAGSNGSGDYVIAFSTAPGLHVHRGDEKKARAVTVLGNEAMSPLFLAAMEATEEAIYNSLFKATTVTGRGRTVEALPVERVVEILKKHGMVR